MCKHTVYIGREIKSQYLIASRISPERRPNKETHITRSKQIASTFLNIQLEKISN